MRHWHWTSALVYVFTVLCTVAVFAYARNADRRNDAHRRSDCRLVLLIANNQRLVLTNLLTAHPQAAAEFRTGLAELTRQIDHFCPDSLIREVKK